MTTKYLLHYERQHDSDYGIYYEDSVEKNDIAAGRLDFIGGKWIRM